VIIGCSVDEVGTLSVDRCVVLSGGRQQRSVVDETCGGEEAALCGRAANDKPPARWRAVPGLVADVCQSTDRRMDVDIA